MITTVPVVNVEGFGWQEYISDANNNIFVQYAPASGAGSAIYAYYDQSTGRAVTDSADSFMRFYQVEGVGVVPVTVGLTGEGWVPLGSAQAEGEQVWVTPVQGGENIYERLEYDALAQAPWAGTGEYYRQDGQETWVKTTAPAAAVTLEERVFDYTKYTALSIKSEAGDSHIVRNDGIIDWIESGGEYWSNLIFEGDSKEESSKGPAPTGLIKYSPENVHVLMMLGDTALDLISQEEFLTNETARKQFLSQYEFYDYRGALYLQLLTEIGVPEENIVVLSNNRAAGLPLPSIPEEYTELIEEDFYVAVQTMMENVDENDLFVLVYLGHGMNYDDGNGVQYVITAAGDAIIPGKTLALICNIVDSENTLVILGNCFSGNLITDLSACERSDSLLVLTASGAGEVSTTQGALSLSCEANGDSDECSIEMGEFHSYSTDLLKALFSNEADTDGDGITSFEEAHTITAPEMTARFTDHPQIWDGNESCQIAIDLSRIDGSSSIGANADNDCAALAYAYLAAEKSGEEISEKEFFGLADNFKAASGMDEDGVSIEQMLKGFYSLGMNYKYEEVNSLDGLEAGAVILTKEGGMLHAMVLADNSGPRVTVYTCEEGWNNGGVELENIDPEELTIKGALIPAGTDASGLDRSREMTISVSSPGSIFYDNDSSYLYSETYFDAKGEVTGTTSHTEDNEAYFSGSVRALSHDGWTQSEIAEFIDGAQGVRTAGKAALPTAEQQKALETAAQTVVAPVYAELAGTTFDLDLSKVQIVTGTPLEEFTACVYEGYLWLNNAVFDNDSAFLADVLYHEEAESDILSGIVNPAEEDHKQAHLQAEKAAEEFGIKILDQNKDSKSNAPAEDVRTQQVGGNDKYGCSVGAVARILGTDVKDEAAMDKLTDHLGYNQDSGTMISGM
ncbi:MAG: hypothetical protein PHV68_10105, partial [Candidatus Gastranaerophilales bacterium]|nr:hypothetical protein [Candidatus Gastranaerophilales bacterium]